MVVACAEPDPAARRAVTSLYGETAIVVRADTARLLAAAQRLFRARLSHDAVYRLHERTPQFSARRAVTRLQAATFVSALIAMAAAIALMPRGAPAFAMVLALCYIANIAFRLLLFCAAASPDRLGVRVSRETVAALKDSELPVYSILVPLYREANVVRRTVRALAALDYPADKLDIKLILEEDDCETIAAAEALNSAARFEIVRVPPSAPRTKPKATNFALALARGAYVVVFDAEDWPEQDQLRKAVAAFRALPETVACLQARLNFYNAGDNWLTRMFALEYAAWFDYLLPGLARLGVPIPLGGTSNHFRTDILRRLHGWDAFNVTEDADLGLRLARCGYRVLPLDSSTYEEAPGSVGCWIRQRTRWLKGYMQTVLVHSRAPLAFIRAVGLMRYCGLFLFVGGAVLTNLLSPLVWLTSLLWMLGRHPFATDAAPFLLLLAGNAVLTALAMLAPVKRGWSRLAPYGTTVVFYGLLVSVAAYRALWEFVRKRFHWNKTEHGLTPSLSADGVRQMPYVFSSARLGWIAAACLAAAISGLAYGNPWLKPAGEGEAILNLMVAEASAGFAPAGRAADAASDLHVEYGAFDNLTLVADSDVTYDKPGATRPARTRFDTAWMGARMQLARWEDSVVSLEGAGGLAGLYDTAWPSRALSLNGVAAARLLFGHGFDLFGRHAFTSVEGGWRWRGGAAADEATFDMTLGMAPWRDGLLMLQSFSAMSTGSARPPYRRYDMHKLQLSVAQNLRGALWVQAGLIETVAGTEAGTGGAMIALWWRF